jgi:hypothetical protein
MGLGYGNSTPLIQDYRAHGQLARATPLSILYSVMRVCSYSTVYDYRGDNLRRPNAIPKGVGGTE